MSILDRVRGMLSSPADRAIRAMVDDGDDSPHAKSVPTGGRIATAPRRQYGRGLDEALDADPGKWVSIFREAETGRVSRMVDGYKSTRLLDSRLDAVCAKRALALQGKRIVWKAPPGFEGDTEAKRVASMVARLWNSTRGSSAFLGHMAHAFLEGHAIAEKIWHIDPGTGWWTPAPGYVHPNRVAWNDQIKACLCTPGVDPFPGTPLDQHPDRFFFFSPIGGRSDYPWRRGAMRARVIPSTLKRLSARGWISALERWGQPQIVAYYDDGDDADDVLTALRNIGIDWRARFPKDSKVEAIPVSVSENLHKLFVDQQNTEDAIAILAQNLTTEAVGGSFAAVAGHSRVAFDVLLSDATELAEFLTDQFAEPVVRFNASGAPVPYAEITLTPPREWTVAEWQAGLCTEDEYRQAAGYDLVADGSGKRRFGGTAPSTPGPKPGPAPAEPPKPSDTGEPGANTPDDGET